MCRVEIDNVIMQNQLRKANVEITSHDINYCQQERINPDL